MGNMYFDASQVAPDSPQESLPVGKYPVYLETSEVAPTKAGNGLILKCTFVVHEGQFKGAKIFSNINVQNQNNTAQRIGQAQLSQLCHAVGKLQIQDSSELHSIPLQIRLKLRKKDKPDDPERTEVAEYLLANGASITGGASSMPATQASSQPPVMHQATAPVAQPQFQPPAAPAFAPPSAPAQQFTPSAPAASAPVNSGKPSWVR